MLSWGCAPGWYVARRWRLEFGGRFCNLPPVRKKAYGWGTRQTQIPFGNDRKKSKGESNDNSKKPIQGFFATLRMTE